MLLTIFGFPLLSTFLASPAIAQSLGQQRRDGIQDLGFYNPTDNGGSWLTTWNEATRGEPINIVISSLSDPQVLSYDGFLDYFYSIRFSTQCFQWYDGGAQQAANLGDGNRIVNQTTILRYNYDDPIFGTCSQTLQGGNHFRVFHQNGTEADSGAWFLAASKEHNLSKNHMIVPNGYDVGRDEIVALASNPDGTRSPISKTLYKSNVRAVRGERYFGNLTAAAINHEIGTDGRIAVLTIEIVEPGNGETASTTWIATIRLPEFLIFIGTFVLLILSIGLFCYLHYHHHRHSPIALAPWESGGRRIDEKAGYPLLDRSV